LLATNGAIQIVVFTLHYIFFQRFHTIHTGFHADLNKAVGVSRDGGGTTTIADCFVTWKEKFLLYGDFCSNLPKAQDLLDKLCNSNQLIQQRVLVRGTEILRLSGSAYISVFLSVSVFVLSLKGVKSLIYITYISQHVFYM